MRTNGIAAVAENISFVDVAEANFASDFARAVQSLRRSARLVLQFEIGMKRGEVQRNVGAEMLENPFGELLRFGLVVVESGNHQVGDFEPDAGFFFQMHESFENRFEMRQRDFAVEIFGKGFQVDVGGVNVIVNFVKRFLGDVAVRNHHGIEAAGVGNFANVDDVFGPNGGLVVSERNRGAAMVNRKLDDLLGLDVRGVDLVAARFGNVPVLAEKAAHVASGGAHGKHFCAGKKMIERLFFDGIDLNGGRRGVAEAVEFAVTIYANEAVPGLSFSDVAVTRTEVTVDFAVRVGFPPACFVEGFGVANDLQVLHEFRSFR